MKYFFLLLIFSQALISSLQATELVTFKLTNGLVKYESNTLSGNSITILSPAVGYYKTLGDNTLVGLTFDIFFSLKTKAVSLFSFGAYYQYYFYGTGSSTRSKTNEIEISSISKWAYFGSASFKRYSYYLGSNKLEETRFDQNGNFFNFDLGIGAKLDIGQLSSMTLLISNTFVSLASSDDRVKFRTTFLSLGILKEF